MNLKTIVYINSGIAEALEVSQTLEQLFLIKNGITEVGAKALAKALLKNRSLKALNLDFNDIGNNGAKSFLVRIFS